MIIEIIKKINLKKLFLIFLLGVFVFGGIFAAQAQTTSTVVSGIANEAKQSPNETDKVSDTKTQITQMKEIGGFGGVVIWIGSKILIAAAAGVDFTIALGDGLVGIKAVQTGWNIVLQFTNLGFVLAIIIIAFATILRMESYGMKKILWKLVVAALLVNFSLVIAGAFISMSSTLSDVFIKQSGISGTNANLSIALGNAIQPQKLGQVQERDAGFWDKLTNTLNYFFEYLAGLFFVIVFTFLAALALLTLFIMLLVRIIALMILLIVAPVVWLLWIFPATDKYWKQWWTEFLRWNFFAPVVLFFVYLAVATAAAFQTNDAALKDEVFEKALTKSQTQYSAAASVNKSILNPQLDSVPSSQNGEGFFGYAAQLLVVLGMLYGGIYVANKFSIYGGGLGVDIAQSTGKGAGKWAGRLPFRAGSAAMRPWQWGEKAGGWIRGRGENLSSKAKNMKWYNPVKYAAGWSGKKITSTGGAVERAPSYKAPTLYQSIRKEVYGKDKKEPPNRIKQTRKDIGELIKTRKDMEDIKIRIALKEQVDIDLYEKLKKKDEDKLVINERINEKTKLQELNARIENPEDDKIKRNIERVNKQISDIDSGLEKLNDKLIS